MERVKVGILNKKRGNFTLQEKFRGPTSVSDSTDLEVEHHRAALAGAGYEVVLLNWDADIVRTIRSSGVGLVFNVSSLVEAALLEDLGVPYVGSDTSAIAVSVNKALRRAVAHRVGLIQQPVLIERFLEGREVTLGVLGNEAARVLPPLEIVYREGDVTLSFEKKEMDDDSFVCPARLDDEQTRSMSNLALRAYHALGFRDFGRIDTILTADGPFLLEANAFAGLMCTPRRKPHSYIGVMTRAEGKAGKDLLGDLLLGVPLAVLARELTARLLRAVGLDVLSEKTGFTRLLQRGGVSRRR